MPERRRRRSTPCVAEAPIQSEIPVDVLIEDEMHKPTAEKPMDNEAKDQQTTTKKRRARSEMGKDQPSIADVLFSGSVNDISNFEDSMIPQTAIGSVLPFAEESLTEQERKQQELYPDTFIPIPSSYDTLQTTETLRWNEPIVPIGRNVDQEPIVCFPTQKADDEHFPPQFHFEEWKGGQPISAMKEQPVRPAPYEYYAEMAPTVGRSYQTQPMMKPQPTYQAVTDRQPIPEARVQPPPSAMPREQRDASAYNNNATTPYAIQRTCDDPARYAPHPDTKQADEPIIFEKGHWARTVWMVISVLIAVCLMVLFFQIFMLLYQSNQQTQSLYSQEDDAYLQSSSQTDTSVELLPSGQTYAPTQEPVVEVTPSPTPIIQLSS